MAVLTLGLAFTVLIGVFTVMDLVRHGPTLPGVLGVAVVALLAVALTGALLHPPRR